MNDASARPLAGRRLLVVEDDYFIAADLARTLETLGAQVIGPVGSVADALGLIERASGQGLDGAILDVHLGDDRVFPVADALASRAVPFVFVTGYDRAAIPETYSNAPRCEKPVDKDLLVRVLAKVGVAAPVARAG